MTPAVTLLDARGIPYEILRYDPSNAPGHGLRAAADLHLDPALVWKTLIVETEAATAVAALVPATSQLDLKRLAKAAATRSARLASPAAAERVSGYRIGGICPIGLKRNLPVWIDKQADQHSYIYISAGRRGLELKLALADLINLTRARLARIT